jgi:hypothetical protein
MAVWQIAGSGNKPYLIQIRTKILKLRQRN